MKTIAFAAVSCLLAFGAANADSLGKSLIPSLSDQADWYTHNYDRFNTFLTERPDVEPDTVAIKVLQVDGDPLSGRLETRPIQLTDGQTYTLTFQGRANSPHDIIAIAQRADGDKANVGLNATEHLGFPYVTYRETFTAHGVSGHPVLISFAVATVTGRLWIRDATLTQVG